MEKVRLWMSCKNVRGVAILIRRTQSGTHAGLLYFRKKKLFLTELRWHNDFQCVQMQRDHPCAVPKLEREEIDTVIGFCWLIHKRHNEGGGVKVPYAFRYDRTPRIDPSTGEILLGNGIGLTCSTFVLTVFESAGIPLITLDGWDGRATDIQAYRELLAKLKIDSEKDPTSVPTEHVSRLEKDVSCCRVRPEEAAAACLFEVDDWPMRFSTVEQAGAWVLAALPTAGTDEQ